MSRYYYDLHNHSCLSPCADNDSTPNNLAGMAFLSGLNIVALTDHNTAKNCPAFFKAAAKYGIIPVAGIELTTSEDIHLVCLFEELDSALKFDAFLQSRRVLIKNREEIFGEQLILDGEDNVIGKEEYLLSNATNISVEDACDTVKEFGGVCYPAHIDRDSNGIVAILGTVPENLPFKCVEFHFEDKIEEYTNKYPISGKTVIVSSDSHCLTDINDKNRFFELDCPDGTADEVRKKLFEILDK